MKSLRREERLWVRLAVLILTTSVLVAACGDDDDGATPSDDAPASDTGSEAGVPATECDPLEGTGVAVFANVTADQAAEAVADLEAAGYEGFVVATAADGDSVSGNYAMRGCLTPDQAQQLADQIATDDTLTLPYAAIIIEDASDL